MPLLVVRGERSIVTPSSLVDLCRESAPSLELVDVPGFHNVLWDAFDETADAIEASSPRQTCPGVRHLAVALTDRA